MKLLRACLHNVVQQHGLPWQHSVLQHACAIFVLNSTKPPCARRTNNIRLCNTEPLLQYSILQRACRNKIAQQYRHIAQPVQYDVFSLLCCGSFNDSVEHVAARRKAYIKYATIGLSPETATPSQIIVSAAVAAAYTTSLKSMHSCAPPDIGISCDVYVATPTRFSTADYRQLCSVWSCV
jgi:hypothetical protein